MKTWGFAQRDLYNLFEAGVLGTLSDGELLERFVARRDEAAFEAIVRRHGPMVLGVCRRVLGDHHDAEDAFQAVFLVLARKAGSVRPGSMLPNWLHGVAHQVAIKARAIIGRRKLRERQVTAMPEPSSVPSAPVDDLRGLIDRELSRLPDKYRAPVILCELEGLGHKEAALRLGWPVGTVSGRLSRARAILARRLTRRGLALPGGMLAVALGEEAASAAVPASLIHRTIQAALPFALGQSTAAGVIPVAVASLSNRILGGMMRTKLIATAAVLLAVGTLLLGGVAGRRILAGHAARGMFRPIASALGVTDDPASTDAKLIQGTWQGVEIGQSGTQAPAREARNNVLIFEGEELVMRSMDGPMDPMGRARFKLDPRQTPAAIDITPLDGPERGQTLPGIYKIEKNRLMIYVCPGEPGKIPRQRPSGFSTRDGDGVHFLVLERVGPKGPVDPGPSDPTLATYEVIRRDYDRAWMAFIRGQQGRRAREQPKPEDFAARCLKLAQEKPGTREEVFALCWAAVNAPASEPGKKAFAILEGGRLAHADSVELSQALETSRHRPFLPETPEGPPPSPIAPLVLRRAERNLDDPVSAELLTWVCRNTHVGGSPEPARMFARAADLIAARFPDSPKIADFCDNLGNLHGGNPPWAPRYERHLRTILDRNRDPWVRCTAMIALASIVWRAGPARQDEAVKLYESFIQQFQHPSDPRTRDAQADRVRQAREELKKIRDHQRGRRRIGRPADDRSSMTAQNQSDLSTTLINGSPRTNRPTFSTSVARCRPAMTGE